MLIHEYVNKYIQKRGERRHASFVSGTSRILYDKLLPRFREELEPLKDKLPLLDTAAKIHDIGKRGVDEVPDHHKIGASMVMENGIEGFDEEETLIVANLVRYHKGKHPQDTHKLYSALKNEESKEIVKKFAAILKLADALDYTDSFIAPRIDIEFEDKKMILKLPNDPLRLEDFEETFNKKKMLFEEVFGVEVQISA